MTAATPAALLRRIWRAGVEAVGGDTSVTAALEKTPVHRPDRILAVGKAALPMARAAVRHFGGGIPALAITKYGHGSQDTPGIEVIEAAHPVPDAASLAAGARLLAEVSAMGAREHLLLLVSGGASALVEVPEAGRTLDDLVAENRRLLSAGLDIARMNRRRREMSRIKGGRLLAAFGGSAVTVLAISDVQGDDIAVIGSGIGACPPEPRFACETRIVASNAIARAACAAAARAHGLAVFHDSEDIYDDVASVAARIGATLRAGRRGLGIWGGEPVVTLPENPGRGGRNQALALLLAREIRGDAGLSILAAGTDGSDGPTTAAGGFADGKSWDDAGEDALRRADSGTWLAERGLLFEPGPTGTNVMDLVLGLRL